MNDIRRTLLWVVFTMSLVLLWDAWNKHTGAPSMSAQTADAMHGRFASEHTTGAPERQYGNGTIDAGETAVVSVQVRSNRDVPSTGVEAFLTTSEPGVRMLPPLIRP